MNNKHSIKINIIDILLVVAAIAVAAIISVYLFADKIQDGFSPRKNIYVSANAEKIEEQYANSISKGDRIFNTANGEFIGTVSSVTLSNSYESYYSADGVKENVYYPDLYDVTLIIASTVSENYSGSIKTGAELNFSNKNAAFDVKIVSVSYAEEFMEISPSYGQRDGISASTDTESEG